MGDAVGIVCRIGAACAVVVLTGCANVGPSELASCLNDTKTMNFYKSFPSEKKILIAGIKDNIVNCYWDERLPIRIFTDSPYTRCSKEGNIKCTTLMINNEVVFRDNGPYVRPTPAGNGPSISPVVWHLLGAFLGGMAQGYVESQNQPAPAIIYAPQQQAPRQPLNCRAKPMTMGAPEYVCQ